MSRRVVVTGIGLVSSLGIGTEANWAGALRRPERHRADHPVRRGAVRRRRIAGEVKGFDPLAFIEKKDVKKMDVFIQYAIAASQFAMDDARLTVTPEIADARRRVHRVGHRRVHAPSSASTRRCSRAGRARSRRSSSRRPSSTWPPARSRSASAPRGRTRRPAPPARRRRTRSATPSRSSSAATPT